MRQAVTWLFLRAFLGVPLLFLLFHLYGLDRARPPWFDDTMYAAPAHYLVSEGRFCYGLEPGVAELDQVALRAPPLGSWVTAAWYWLVGFSAYRTRLLFLLAAAGTLWLFAHWLRRLLGRWTGLDQALPWLVVLGSALLATDRVFVWAARAGRPEPLALSFVCAALYLACRERGAEAPAPSRLLGAGAAFGCAMNVHPLAALFGPALLLQWFCQREAEDPPPARPLLGLALGSALPFLPWLLLVASHGEAARVQLLGNVAHHGGVDLGAALADEWRERWWRAYRILPFHLLAFVLSAALLGHGAARRDRRGWLALASLIAIAGLTLKVRKEAHVYYLAYVLPLLYATAVCGVAAARARLRGQAREPLLRRGLVVLFSLALLNGLLLWGMYPYVAWTVRRERSQERLEQALREAIPAGAVVVGPAEAWFAARRCGYTYYLDTLYSHVADYERRVLEYERNLHQLPVRFLLARTADGAPVVSWRHPRLGFPAARLRQVGVVGDGRTPDFLQEWFLYSGGWRLSTPDPPPQLTVFEVLPPG